MKSQVGEVVRELWKLESTVFDRVENTNRISSLREASHSLHSKFVTSAGDFLASHLHESSLRALSEVLILYPVDVRLQYFAAKMTVLMCDNQRQVFLDYITEYAKKKLEEVVSLSEKQVVRSVHTTISAPIDSKCIYSVDASLYSRTLNSSLAQLFSFYVTTTTDGIPIPEKDYFTSTYSNICMDGRFSAGSFVSKFQQYANFRNEVVRCLHVLSQTIISLASNCISDLFPAGNMIGNVYKMLLVALDSFADICGSSSTGSILGKIQFEFSKFFLSTLQYLFVLDEYDNSKGANAWARSALFAVDCHLMSKSSFTRLLVVVGRKTSLSFYQRCRGIANSQSRMERQIIQLFNEYCFKYRLVFGIDSCINESDLMGTTTDVWYRNPSIKHTLLSAVGVDLVALVDQLTSKLSS